MRWLALALLLGLASAALPAPVPAQAPASAAALPVDAYPDVARAYWVEVNGAPVWAGGRELRLPMASLAKLMTALLLAEEATLDEEFAVSAAAARATGSRIGLRAGERMRATDLFDAMLVRSANDACRALADWHGGDLPRFVARMNARAAELGLRDTTFANACGHDAPGQASSVRDLAVLARAAMEPQLWTHALALVWQGLAVLALVKGGSLLFRKRVMKSGGAGRVKTSRFARRTPVSVEPAE